RTKEYRYTVSDEIEDDSGNIYVKKTTERLEIWTGNPYGDPDKVLDLETVYTPRYMLLKNVLNPASESLYNTTVKTDVTWSYIDPYQGNLNFTESFSVPTSITVGDPVTLATDAGEFNCVPITITQESTVKKWWLAPGQGIVRLLYYSFGSQPVADLFITNLTDYSNNVTISQKNVLEYIIPEPHYLCTVPIPARDNPERMKKLSSLFRNFCPR
ncbi:unnamed protein product, partial [marine sediment metagenome]